MSSETRWLNARLCEPVRNVRRELDDNALMQLTAGDRLDIADLVVLHGHLMDEGGLDRLGELFAEGVAYDLEDFGLGTLRGIDAIRSAALAMGDRNPLAHHVTNVLIESDEDDGVRVRSKGLAVNADGSAGSVVYEDVVRRGEQGWRIAYRKVKARRTPLEG